MPQYHQIDFICQEVRWLLFFLSEIFPSVVHTRGNKCMEYKFNSTRHTLYSIEWGKEKEKGCRLFPHIYTLKCATFDNDRRQWWKWNPIYIHFCKLYRLSTNIELDIGEFFTQFCYRIFKTQISFKGSSRRLEKIFTLPKVIFNVDATNENNEI